jgi:hypothetical protein
MYLPKSRRVLGSLLVLLIALPATAASASGAGQSCKKVGALSSTKSGGKGTKLVCTKVGKKLVWVATEVGVTVPVEIGTYSIGDAGPGGGIVFYDAGSHQPWGRYLESAPADSATGIEWCNNFSASIVGTKLTVGTGRANTTKMLARCTSGAARSADAYVAPNGTADWFLPSIDELGLMYTNLKSATPSLGSFSNLYFWASSDYSGDYAYFKSFNDGTVGAGAKYGSNISCVRPVRAFG